MLTDNPQPRTPKLKSLVGYPEWFHNHGDKMLVVDLNSIENRVTLLGSAARLEIHSALAVRDGLWRVTWHIDHPRASEADGQIFLDGDELAAAFGFKRIEMPLGNGWLIERHGGDVGLQGKFIVWGSFLNIPCPGTGNDDDPNISIRVTEAIKTAIGALLGL